MDVKNSIYLVFKEAVNNLSKYSGGTHATLSLLFDEKYIHLKVEDNGTGFNPDQITHQGGFINMRHRAAEMKGTLHITSGKGIGTSVHLTVPRYL